MERRETLEPLRQLEFKTLQVGDVVTVVTGTEDQSWRYRFDVTDTSTRWPDGTLTATKPDGDEIGPANFALHGCGQWTTRQQNPVQDQMGLAFTPYYDGLIVSHFMWGKLEGTEDRIVFDKQGQEISEISVQKA